MTRRRRTSSTRGSGPTTASTATANSTATTRATGRNSRAWAMELYQRGIITGKETGGLDLAWGNYEAIEKLFFLTAAREGFGDTIADSNRAVDRGKEPPEA